MTLITDFDPEDYFTRTKGKEKKKAVINLSC
jgi:hypothetical protein